jgi:hypothetical protein
MGMKSPLTMCVVLIGLIMLIVGCDSEITVKSTSNEPIGQSPSVSTASAPVTDVSTNSSEPVLSGSSPIGVKLSHPRATDRQSVETSGINPGEALAIDLESEPGARIQFSISTLSPYRTPKGDTEQEQVGKILSSSPEMTAQGEDNTVCLVGEEGRCQIVWVLGSADFLMDPFPDDGRGANVEIILTDNVKRPSGISYEPIYIAVLGTPDLTKVNVDP